MMRNATTEYYFYLSHDLNYENNSKIVLTIGDNSYWEIHDVKLMFGFKDMLNYHVHVNNAFAQSVAEIMYYGNASKELQQVIAVNLTSSDIIGDHKVKIETFIDDKLSGTWTGFVKLNSTWGSFNRLSFSAVRQPEKLSVA